MEPVGKRKAVGKEGDGGGGTSEARRKHSEELRERLSGSKGRGVEGARQDVECDAFMHHACATRHRHATHT